MKRSIFYIISLAVALLTLPLEGWAQQSEVNVAELWQGANDSYVDKNYSAAIEGYSAILDSGVSSAELLYNLGNAYYKRGELAKAILYYNKALKLSPTDADIIYNLKNVAEAQTRDHIEVLPEFFMFTLHRGIYSNMNSNQWVIFSLVMLVIGCSFSLLFLLTPAMALRKIGFFGAFLFFILFASATSYSVGQRREMMDDSQAIVMDRAITVKSSPDSSATDLFILHEGTKVELGKSMGDWVEITIADGKRGWISRQSVDII